MLLEPCVGRIVPLVGRRVYSHGMPRYAADVLIARTDEVIAAAGGHVARDAR